jgi:hypothetical protein
VNAWVQVAPTLGAETYILSLAVYNGKLYGGTVPNGNLYEWNGVNAWVQVAPKLGAETYIYSLAVYNGKLYGGTYPNGKLYEWNGVNAWVQVAPTLGAETYILSLAVYNGKLYGGTVPNSNLYEWKTGKAVSYNYELKSGVRHITAVKKSLGGTTSNLKIYSDGRLLATSDTFTTADYNISNAVNLLVGLGEQDYFNGYITMVRLYNTGLSPAEVMHNYTHSPYYLLQQGIDPQSVSRGML